jgi:asparagine synthase (glutamine-hydrolysing)
MGVGDEAVSKASKIGLLGLKGRSILFGPVKFRAFRRRNPVLAKIVERVCREHLSYLNVYELCELADCVLELKKRGIPGVIIEAGCARGGSALVMAGAKELSRQIYLYDVFGVIPEPTQKDGIDAHDRYRVIRDGRSAGLGGQLYYGYDSNLLDKVTGLFKEFGLAAETRIVKGLFQETLQVTEPVALAHIDCDWYDSVWTCLTRIAPHLSPGGRLIIDDYFVWSGCKQAVDEYFSGVRKAEYRFQVRSRLHILKMPGALGNDAFRASA